MRHGIKVKHTRHSVATTTYADEQSQDTRQLIPLSEPRSEVPQSVQEEKMRRAEEKRQKRSGRQEIPK